MIAREPPGQISSAELHGAALGLRRLFARRTLWHTAGLLLAAVLAWLVLRAYRDPDLLLDLATFRFC